MAIPRFHYNNMFSASPLPCGDYLLYQAGEMYCENNTGIKAHRQRCHELTFCVDGCGEVSTNGVFSPIGKDCCYYSSVEETHSIVTDPVSPLRFKFLGFEPYTPAGKKHVELIEKYAESANERVTLVPALNALFLDIFSEIEHPDAYSYELMGDCISRILIEVTRVYEHSAKARFPDKISHGKELVYHVINYLDTNFYKIRSLTELEQEFNYSYNHISAVFHKTMGITLVDYLKKIKMEEAKKLLTESKLTVTEISEKLNFSCIHAFSRSFKEYFGTSPKQFGK